MVAMFDAIIGWANLCLAYRFASRGKRGKASVAAFEYQVADRLVAAFEIIRLLRQRCDRDQANEPER